jgi:hypothetical protein
MPDVFTIAHMSTYLVLKNPIFVQVPRLVSKWPESNHCVCVTN